MVVPVAAAQAEAQPTIIIVNLEDVIAKSTAGILAQKELEEKMTALQARANELRTRFDNEAQSLVRDRPGPNAPSAAISAWETEVRNYETRKGFAEQGLAKSNSDFETARQYVVQQLTNASQPLILQIMQERGALVVLSEGATLQYNASTNVTDDVIARLDRVVPRVSTTPLPASAKE